MSLFGDLDIASAADNPFEIPANSYEATVTDVRVGKTRDESKVGMTFIYTIQSGEYEGQDITEWKQIPTPADPHNLTTDEKRSMSFLKQRLLSLGVPEDRMNSVKEDELIGADVVVTVKPGKNGYTNVSRVELM